MNFKKLTTYLYLLPLFGLLAISACDIINPEEDIPSFIYIESIDFVSLPEQGTADQSFPIFEILSGTSNFGTHSLPVTVPLLIEGTHTLDIFPGINENGISAFPNIYNMVQFDPITVDLIPGQIDTLHPVSRYKEDLLFPIQETFENSTQVFREDADGDAFTEITLDSEEVFEGTRSGKATINKEHPILEVLSTRITEFPPKSTFVYMEMNYKSEAEFSVGVYWTNSVGERSSNVVNFINPKNEWNKIYFNFTDIFDAVNGLQGVTDWQIGINSTLPIVNGEFIDAEQNIWVDNIKLIHFEL